MRTKISLLVAVIALMGMVVPQAHAQKYPTVTQVAPFSPQCNFMSRVGYLRYRYFTTTGKWISWEEAVRITLEQEGRTVPPSE